MRFFRWLLPGMGIKRWLFVFALGVLLAGIGLAVVIDCRLIWWMEKFTMQWFGPGRPLARAGAGFASAALGLALSAVAVNAIVRSVYQMAVPKSSESLGKILLSRKNLERGPKIVVVGGGTGLSSLLRGLKEYTDNITALVTVSDDGGSSGRLRTELGILPPGDIRNCLVALADAEPLMQTLFQHRFKEGGDLSGHNFGNLFIAALAEITGDFEAAVRQSSKVLAVRGRVLPASLDNVVLCAELEDGTRLKGETAVGRVPSPIKRVYIEPEVARPTQDALSAIEEADLVVMGPGSLYTSVISSLVIAGIADAIARSAAFKVYVCNIMTQPNETAGYTAEDHVRAIIDHAGRKSIDAVLLNTERVSGEELANYATEGATQVSAESSWLERAGFLVAKENLLASDDSARHNPQELARSVMKLLLQHRGSAIRNRLLRTYLHPDRTKG